MSFERDPVLIILHQEHSTPGRVGAYLEQRGFALDIRRPRFGDGLPETMDHHAGAVIFGGPMSANDPDDFIKRETDWISVPLRDKAPFLGICLGAQMMSRNLGGEVLAHPDQQVEVGYYPIQSTEAGQSLLQWPDYVYQWHSEGFTLPTGAERLAGGNVFANQAMRYGEHAYGIQFHPEVTMEMMERWTTHGADRLGLRGAQPAAAHFAGRAHHDVAVADWLDRFLDMWIGQPGAVAVAS